MTDRKKKLINKPENIVQEMLEGIVAAYPDIIRLTDDRLIVRAEAKAEGKVALVIGNGTGHEPAMIGLVGKGLFDVNIPGEIFAAPGPERILAGIKTADRGGGVLVCVSHHAGDLMNTEMALELCEMKALDNVEMVVLYDDISSAPKGQESKRRGTAGLFFVWKMLGAYAEGDVTLAQCKAMAEKIRDNTRSLAVALTPGTNPMSGEVMFELPDDEIEIGMGVHGEVGQGRRKMCSADELVDSMLPEIIDDLPYVKGDDVLVLINDSGSMTQMEMFILFRRISQILSETGINIYKSWIGRYATTQEMAGLAISLCRVDEELKELWDAPAIGANIRIVQS